MSGRQHWPFARLLFLYKPFCVPLSLVSKSSWQVQLLDVPGLQKICVAFIFCYNKLLCDAMSAFSMCADDPQDAVVAQMYKNDLEQFNRKAAEWTQNYAKEITMDDKV